LALVTNEIFKTGIACRRLCLPGLAGRCPLPAAWVGLPALPLVRAAALCLRRGRPVLPGCRPITGGRCARGRRPGEPGGTGRGWRGRLAIVGQVATCRLVRHRPSGNLPEPD